MRKSGREGGDMGVKNKSEPLKSCLYECSVMHHRLVPKEHRFQYRIFMFYLDLDELDEAASRTPFFSRSRFNLYTFCDSDHLKIPGFAHPDLKENVVRYLEENGISFPEGGRISLLTLPRALGYIFNPVSFYFCFDENGKAFCAITQVGNTFSEMKLFLFRAPQSENFFRLTVPKHFYVSPFSSLEIQFDFKLRVPSATMEIHIDDRNGDDRILVSCLSGKRATLDAAHLAWFTVKYPFITFKVIFLIHFHALLLWLKRIPFYNKIADPELQRDVLNPHASLQTKAP